ncbi:coiled-coil domain-containing protein 66-like isoform X2 [Branchiostoma lanceolatum]|uniref:coiled-coil domain-containing protein 66-like isoform X2 n=1 Tax=Branchiostoma lanceolatum TaxID=7740 RepID=UPI003456C6A6
MNFGGNLAVQIHDGKPAIFPVRGQPQPKKKKKDIYLSKQNKHPLRRPAQEEPANENRDGGPTSNQNQAKKTKPANRKPPPNPRTKRGKDDGKGTKTDGKPGEGTVTLTQEQLNAILASIGKTTDTSSAVNVQIENNEVKIVSTENGQQGTGEAANTDNGAGDMGQEVSGQSEPTADVAQNQPAENTARGEGTEQAHKQAQPATEPASQQQPYNNTHSTTQQSSYGGLLSTIGKEEEDKRTAAEARKTQLRRELEEQIADKKRRDQKARDRSAVERAQPVEDYVPWGRPGAGAPLRSQSGKVMAEYGDTRRSQQKASPRGASDTAVQQAAARQQPQLNYTQSSAQPEPAATGQARRAVSTVPPPHAMRSSFAIGGAAPGGDQYVTKDQDDKKKWLQELEEQIADKKRRDQKARDRSAVERAQPVEDYVPWGRPGAGAPLRSQSGKVMAEYGDTRRSQQKASPRGASDTAVQQAAARQQPQLNHTQSPGQPEPAATGQAHRAVSTVPPPHAMRSSFAIGGAAPGGDQYVTKDQDDKKKWLQELEKQREEARLRKQREKQRDKEGDGMDAWTRHFDTYHPATQEQPPPRGADAQPTVPEPHPQRTQSPTPVVQDAVVQEADHHATLRSSLERRAEPTHLDDDSVNFLRTGAALKDPAQLEELEKRRLKDLEHKRAIQEQVEERQRVKREERERRAREEAEEEQRLARERQTLQDQFDRELQDQRRKEELLNQKTKMLFESMQQAEQQALQEKRQQRMRHLERHGHDVSNLRHTFESTEPQLSYRSSHPAEVPPLQGLSPREQFGIIHSHRDPPPHPGASYHSPREADPPPVGYVSPRRETAVQTDPFRLPEQAPVTMPEEGDSSSVEIEYKDSREQARSRQNRDAPKRGKKEPNNRRAATTDSEKENSRTRKKTEKPAEKPRWGASTSKVQGKKFVKASERYPNKLKKKREENLVKRERELKKQMEANSKERIRQRLVEHRSSPEVTGTQGRKSPPVPTLAGKNKNRQDDDDLYTPYERTSRKPKRQEPIRPAQEFKSDSPPVPALRKKAEEDRKERSLSPPQRGELNHPNVRGQRAWDGAAEPVQYDYDSAPRANSPPVPALRSKTKQPGPDRERNPHQSPERNRNPRQSPSKSPDRKPKVRQKSPERYGTVNDHPHSPLRDGDFIPFRRTDDGVLDPQEPMSLPETREAPRVRRRASTDHSPHRGALEQVPDSMRSASAGQAKDPLLNPGMVKNPQRQGEILKQLKSLREGLLMRQREIESCMSPPITAFQPDLQNSQHGPQ